MCHGLGGGVLTPPGEHLRANSPPAELRIDVTRIVRRHRFDALTQLFGLCEAPLRVDCLGEASQTRCEKSLLSHTLERVTCPTEVLFRCSRIASQHRDVEEFLRHTCDIELLAQVLQHVSPAREGCPGLIEPARHCQEATEFGSRRGLNASSIRSLQNVMASSDSFRGSGRTKPGVDDRPLQRHRFLASRGRASGVSEGLPKCDVSCCAIADSPNPLQPAEMP